MKEDQKTTAKRALPVGLQLYSVRSECAKDLPGTIAKVARMGYQGVEFAGYYDYKAADLRKMLDDNGLLCCGTHTAMDTLSDENLAATIDFNKTLGNKFLIVPWLQPEGDNPKATWLKYADRFNVLAEKVKLFGMYVGYHAHAHDFHPLDGELPWDILFGNTRKDVVMQIDTGNASDGGGDPIAALKRYPGRSLTVHIKEYSRTNKNAILGEGDIPWAEVFRICETTGGTQWYIIEEEKDVYPPLVAVEKCLANYRKLRS
ncbi:MAG: xylose isomerase [Planctomycetes bacterium RBG_13_60_9]|nr:MAG: xylose isomerase [Planctomycetes bacterium RBG_13_60_9]